MKRSSSNRYMEKKDIKKLLKIQQEIANETLAYEALVHVLEDAALIEPVERMITERKKHLQILEKLTDTKVTPKENDIRYVRMVYKLFGIQRLFSNLETIMKEKAKDTESLMKAVPQIKEIHQAEVRYQSVFKKLAALEKKKKKLK